MDKQDKKLSEQLTDEYRQKLLKQTGKELGLRLTELEKANNEIYKARHAALNIMEDAIQSRDALLKSEERLQLALEAAKMGTFVYYVQEDCTEPDPQMLALFGLEPGDKLNLAIALDELIHPDDRQRYANDVAEAINPEGNRRLNSDIRVIHPNDGMQWLNINAQVQFEGNPPQAMKITGVCIDITERKQAEEALRTSEEQLRALIKNLPGGAVFVVDKNLQYVLAEGEALAAAGFLSTDIVGKTVNEIVPENIREHYISRYQKALKGEPFKEEHQAHNRTFISRGTPLTNANDEVNAVLAISYDITDRKNAEEALRKSEERLRVTMETAVDFAIINTNVNGMVEGWSKGAEYTFGYTQDEITGKSADILFTPEDRKINVPEKEMQSARQKGFAPDERWHIKKDGSRFFASGVMRPLYNDNKLEGYVKIARDMTESQQAQENLTLLEERNRIALQSAEMASWDWYVDEDSVTWNDQHYYLFGLQPDNQTKKAADFTRHIYKDDIDKVGMALQKGVEETGVYHAEFRIVRADNNEVRWMNGYGRAVSHKGKHATRMIGVMFDITDRKKLEQQKEDFIGIASHELKTPVTSIKAYTELLQEMCAEGDYATGAVLIKKLDAQVDRLIELVHALLDITKMAEGELPLQFTQFSLKELAGERIEDLQRLSNIHHIIIKPQKDITINADKERIGQVITNLISNAIKYSPKGGDVTINWKQTKENTEVSIKDEGIGISEEMQSKVFDRFFRANDVKVSTYPGMGLGLYITADIIKRHGGEIWVKSKPGEGSTFYFTLPVGRE